MGALGRPRLHLGVTESTNDRARELAISGAPHGTLVTAAAQTAGRGRQGRTWVAPPGRALVMSLVVRTFDSLLPLRAGLAVADVAGPDARVKWPNDVLLDGRKVAGVLVEGRPQEGWAVVGVGVNVAVSLEDFPDELRGVAGTLGRGADALEPFLEELLGALEKRFEEVGSEVVVALRSVDALLGGAVSHSSVAGEACGIDEAGRLLVRDSAGAVHALDAGEVHLGLPAP